MGRVEGKIALVTGAAAQPGLGSATAMRLADEGAALVVTDIDGAGAEAVAEAIRGQGGDAVALAHDVTKPAQWEAVFSMIEQRHGRLDVLVNNVGIAIVTPIDETSDADWLMTHDVNINSVFYGCRAAVRLMRGTGVAGSIINISSIAGQLGMPGFGAYCSSKAGVRLLTKAIALETAAEGIRVNSVHPGIIRTQRHLDAVGNEPETLKMLTERIPMARVGDPADIANMNLFLASDEARYVTGAEFVVDGGYSAQ